MALWTAADVITFAPEFSDIAVPVIDQFIVLADGQISEEAWGSRAKHAGILLTAHLLTASKVKDGSGAGGSGVGSIQSLTVGQVAVAYNTGSLSTAIQRGANASLASSVYGLEFERLAQLAAYGAAVV